MKGLYTDQYAIYKGGDNATWSVDLTVRARYFLHPENYIVDNNGDIIFIDEPNIAPYFEIIEEEVIL